METKSLATPRPISVAPGVFHLPLGQDNEAWILDDGYYECDPAGDCAWNASEDDVIAALEAVHLPRNPLRLHALPVLLRWHGEYVLLDAGCGTAYGPRLGHMMKRLQAIGVGPRDIRAVLFSHLHLDHVAGAVDLTERRVFFPEARFCAARGEVAFWNQSHPDASRTRIPAEKVEAILQAIRVPLKVLNARFEVFDPGEEILHGIRAVAAPGHTANHVAFEIGAEFADLVYVGDAFVEPSLHVAHPEWRTIGDMEPDLVPETRRRLCARAAEEGQWLIGYHFSLPGVGTVRRDSNGNFQFELARFDTAEA